ncbi:hypothetical protein CYJ36_08345 [Bacillus sp. UMB0893]|nr:hypothetical protein CYJ36_08345 [Bacillus sp. UMB0893]
MQLERLLKSLNSQKGYTLIEAIIVLSIVAILMLMTFISAQSVQSQKTAELFFEALERDVLHAQQHAIVNKKSVSILFDPANHKYFAVEGGLESKRILTVDYDASITVDPLTMDARILFNNIGGISQSGTMNVYCNKKKYKMIFYMGMGRMYVEEL